MKKIFILSVLTATAFIGHAQIKFGIKAGATFTKFSGDDAKMQNLSPKFRTGFAGGGFANIGLTEALSLQPEVLYSMEGTMYKQSGNKAIFKTDYINVPVLVQYNHESGFYAETGPQVGFLISAKLSDGDNSISAKEGFNKINFSWGLGAGYKLSNGLGIGARYNFGIANIAKSEEGEPSANVKLGGFHVGLSYTLGGSEK